MFFFQSEKVLFGRQKKIMLGFATGPHLRIFYRARANGSGTAKNGRLSHFRRPAGQRGGAREGESGWEVVGGEAACQSMSCSGIDVLWPVQWPCSVL